jgi:hypothetical protein
VTKTNTPKLRKRFERYMKAMPKELDALERAVRAAGGVSLDYTYPSLDALEDFLDATGARDKDDDALFERVSRYIGTTLVRRTGARWDYSRREHDFPGEPLVTAFPNLRKQRYFPMSPVNGYRHQNAVGLLRDDVEPLDIVHRREQMYGLAARIDSEIDALRADFVRGGFAGELTFSLESVDALEKSLLAQSAGFTREQERLWLSRVALYLGKIVQRAAGGGAWELCEEPIDVDFGQLTIHGWTPFTLVKNVNPSLNHLILRLNLEKVLKRISLGPKPPIRHHPAPTGPTGNWLVLFERSRAPRIDTVIERVTRSYRCVVDKHSDEGFVLTIADALTRRTVTIEASLNFAPSVLRESAEIADDYAEGAPTHDAVARCDARWELMFDLRDSDETYSVLLAISEALHELCGAFVLAASEQRLLDL